MIKLPIITSLFTLSLFMLLFFNENISSTFSSPIYLPVVFNDNDYHSPKKGFPIIGGRECSDFETLNASWFYRYGPYNSCPNNDTYIPMIVTGSYATDTVRMDATFATAAISGWILVFNEPNVTKFPMTPREAAESWHIVEARADAENVKLVSPSTTPNYPGHIDAYGYAWLSAMVYEYRDLYGVSPRFDAIQVHSYFYTADEAKKYILTVRQMMIWLGYGDKPIWVTEYGGACWDEVGHNSLQVMAELTPWLEQQPWIGRYSWFANRIDPAKTDWWSCSLIDYNTGTLTPLGELYKTY